MEIFWCRIRDTEDRGYLFLNNDSDVLCLRRSTYLSIRLNSFDIRDMLGTEFATFAAAYAVAWLGDRIDAHVVVEKEFLQIIEY